MESWNAVCTPTEACVAPGPRVTKQSARPVGELAVGLGHVGRARLVAADDELQLVAHVVEAVEHREEALARHREREVGAVDHELVDEELAAVARAHSCFTT